MSDLVYEISIADLRAAMGAGRLTSRAIVEAYLARIAQIDQGEGGLRSVLELNPDALAIADALDAERAGGAVRGPLHGIPVLIKDNIDTADAMHTTAGSLALLGSRPAKDAGVARRLRAAGAVILGKTNMSEWANFRSSRSTSGWSGRGRQTRNPYALDRNTCGSSSGSAAAVAASLCAAALGSETDGSIVCPSSLCGVVGIKPTVGLASRAGVIPISATQDTVGPHGRTVADAALLLGAIAGPDYDDPATAAGAGRALDDYTPFLDADGLRGARIGVLRAGKVFGYHPGTDRVAEAAIALMAERGATIIDPVELPEGASFADPAEFEVLLHEFKAGINAYLAGCGGDLPRSLAELIAFNEAHADVEMPYFGQELFLLAEARGGLDAPAYQEALAKSRDGARAAIDGALDAHGLDAIMMPTESPAWLIDLVNGDHFLGGSSGLAARAGYPLVTVPAGDVHGLPVGITFMGRAFSEPTLIRLAHAFEQAAQARRPPQLLATISLP
ncbi:amidase [Oscillochloris sp. ZM17-4]|uniref:amidase n=1 Tax=Oscillochloris sp. ZM17-4 TaxID=2866714 RepID=UPI001C733DD5|nr:amidase [Oscillochloris sp. ZM17-4]MBX0329419.1 amidase [Oscillochloris sp. ZM17-4]